MYVTHLSPDKSPARVSCHFYKRQKIMGLSLLFGLLVVVFFDLCNFLSETGTWYLFHKSDNRKIICGF